MESRGGRETIGEGGAKEVGCLTHILSQDDPVQKFISYAISTLHGYTLSPVIPEVRQKRFLYHLIRASIPFRFLSYVSEALNNFNILALYARSRQAWK